MQVSTAPGFTLVNTSFNAGRVYNSTYTCDTCTYTSGNWSVLGIDNCAISTTINMNRNNLYCTGTGPLSMSGRIYNFSNVATSSGCTISTSRTGKLG